MRTNGNRPVNAGIVYETRGGQLTFSSSSAPRATRAVLDRETGLVWERSPSMELTTWHVAHVRCNEFVTLGSRLGWRLPTVNELASLVDPGRSDPAFLPAILSPTCRRPTTTGRQPAIPGPAATMGRRLLRRWRRGQWTRPGRAPPCLVCARRTGDGSAVIRCVRDSPHENEALGISKTRLPAHPLTAGDSAIRRA